MLAYRFYRPSDAEAAADIHSRSGIEMPFAHPGDPVNAIALVAEKDGQIAAVCCGRRAIEPALSLDRAVLSPAERWEAVRGFLDRGAMLAAVMGIREFHLFPNSERYARRLLTIPGVTADSRIHQWMDISAYGGA